MQIKINSKKVFLFLILVMSFQISFSQNHTEYIQRKNFSRLIDVHSKSFAGDDFLIIDVFQGESNKMTPGTAVIIITYKYLGLDNSNNLHVRRSENNFSLNEEEQSELIFGLKSDKPTELTVIAESSQIEPLQIQLEVEATNNFIRTKYIGDLPIYSQSSK